MFSPVTRCLLRVPFKLIILDGVDNSGHLPAASPGNSAGSDFTSQGCIRWVFNYRISRKIVATSTSDCKCCSNTVAVASNTKSANRRSKSPRKPCPI